MTRGPFPKTTRTPAPDAAFWTRRAPIDALIIERSTPYRGRLTKAHGRAAVRQRRKPTPPLTQVQRALLTEDCEMAVYFENYWLELSSSYRNIRNPR